ncbi:MAG: UDP-4-amino-4,6-dideoxy-N-acetyl-beta-L-altrosamine transaminase [Acidobacteria bacterium]|nr:MAG: UDP-4-amino-4,6-dideoxy-N-acetyl-beta-L-altrosamine transaminase [Acidobacteriota bacterium]
MSVSTIPFHVPSIGPEELGEVERALRSGWLTTGPRTAQFEQEFKQYVDSPFAVAVNSGTAGLHLALAALGIGSGDEVITTPLTFCATVHTILQVGARPVLADIGSDGNIDPESIERCLTGRTRAIMPVHLAGLPCDMQAIWKLAHRHGAFVIEDAAHASGAHYDGHPIGAGPQDTYHASDAIVFSFYATKNLTTGEGGMVVTHREDLARKIRMLSLHGTTQDAWKRYRTDGSWYYEVVAGGYKYNLSDVQSAIGIHQLRKLERFIQVRARYAQMYNQAFAGIDELELPPDRPGCRHAWHLYILRLNLETLSIGRGEFIRQLGALGVSTSVHFIPIPLHPYFAQMSLADYPCPRAMELYPRILSLPLYPAMTEEQVYYVANCVRQVVERTRKSKFIAGVAAGDSVSPAELGLLIEADGEHKATVHRR